MTILRILIAAVLLAATGIVDASAEVATGRWRMVLAVPGGDLPFYVDLEKNGGEYAAYLVNGAERMPVPEVRVTETALGLTLPAFNSRIAAVLEGDELAGTLRLIKEGGRPQVMALTGTHGLDYRFFPDAPAAEVDVSGRWDVTFSDDKGKTFKAIGVFEQQDNLLQGTFMTQTGDYRFLEGQVTGRKMYLSCFDGGHAFLFEAEVGSEGELKGGFWSGTAYYRSWLAVPDAEVQLPDANGVTFLKPGYDRFEFSFPDMNGIGVSLDDERFKDKVVVVTIAGTWCPNCHDEAAFLADYYKENRVRGLEVVGLMYEHYRDPQQALQQVQRFAQRYGVDYPMLLAGFSDKKAAGETLPMLNHVYAYPTNIFIDRKGNVRRIHTGIDGPGTGDAYNTYTMEFRAFVDMLLAE